MGSLLILPDAAYPWVLALIVLGALVLLLVSAVRVVVGAICMFAASAAELKRMSAKKAVSADIERYDVFRTT